MFSATSPALLATAAGASEGGLGFMLMQFAPFILIFVVFYFLLIRPQQQKAKAHRELVDGLRKGDDVITSSGLYGKVTRVNDDDVTIELAEGVRVKMLKQSVMEVRTRTEPANDAASDADA